MNKVNEEAVTVIVDEKGDPTVIVRKSTNNGGKVQLFRVHALGFGEVTAFLKELAGEDKKNNEKNLI